MHTGQIFGSLGYLYDFSEFLFIIYMIVFEVPLSEIKDEYCLETKKKYCF